MTRSIFFGFGAIVGSLDGISTAGFWPGDPITFQWDHAKLVPIDLAKNPQAVRDGTIQPTDIQVDDHVTNSNPGLTQIGPLWPDGTTMGSCWLESMYWYNLPPSIKPPRLAPGVQCYEYELTSYLYWDGALQYRRFCGFHVEIVQEVGTNALVQIWSPGTSGITNQKPYGAWWLDLAAVAHPPDATILGMVGLGAGAPKVGPMYLDTSAINALALQGPKLPWFQGGDCFPSWT